jgi:hypothetical protein
MQRIWLVTKRKEHRLPPAPLFLYQPLAFKNYSFDRKRTETLIFLYISTEKLADGIQSFTENYERTFELVFADGPHSGVTVARTDFLPEPISKGSNLRTKTRNYSYTLP